MASRLRVFVTKPGQAAILSVFASWRYMSPFSLRALVAKERSGRAPWLAAVGSPPESQQHMEPRISTERLAAAPGMSHIACICHPALFFMLHTITQGTFIDFVGRRVWK